MENTTVLVWASSLASIEPDVLAAALKDILDEIVLTSLSGRKECLLRIITATFFGRG